MRVAFNSYSTFYCNFLCQPIRMRERKCVDQSQSWSLGLSKTCPIFLSDAILLQQAAWKRRPTEFCSGSCCPRRSRATSGVSKDTPEPQLSSFKCSNPSSPADCELTWQKSQLVSLSTRIMHLLYILSTSLIMASFTVHAKLDTREVSLMLQTSVVNVFSNLHVAIGHQCRYRRVCPRRCFGNLVQLCYGTWASSPTRVC